MWTHPGKKLLFMGGEFAQEREWSHERALDWQLLDKPLHAGLKRLVRDLNTLYRECPALHAQDCDAGGFEWVEADDAAHSVYAFLRHGGGGHCLVVCNFTPVPREGYRLGVPAPGFYRERLNTDSALYGGSDAGNIGGVQAEAVPSHGRAWSLMLRLPPLSMLVLQPQAS
jgi:1,4-alpha-glucan branching enzyme